MGQRIRSIKPEWLDDEKMVFASVEARVLSIGLILLSDDYGRGRANEVLLSAHVFPREKTTKTLARALKELREMGFVELYEVNEQHYYQIRNWTKHQKVDHPSKQQLPSPMDTLAKSSRNPRESLAHDQDQDQDQDRKGSDQDLSLSSSETEPDRVARQKKQVEIIEVFDHYRTKHPRSHPNPKPTSREWRAIKARLDEGHAVEQLKRAIDGMHLTPHNLGQNERGQQYLGLELCMRNADQVERFSRTAEMGGTIPADRPKTKIELSAEADRAFTEAYNAKIRERQQRAGVVHDAGEPLVLTLPGEGSASGDNGGVVDLSRRLAARETNRGV